MSVFYNLFKKNDTMAIQKHMSFSETPYMPILNNQGDYLVGVKRFKIPSQGVDLFRIYRNRFFLGITLPINSTNPIASNCIIYDLLNTDGANNAGLIYDHDEKEYYTPINSTQRFCDVLNRTIAQSFLSKISGNSKPSVDGTAGVSINFKTAPVFPASGSSIGMAGNPINLTSVYTPLFPPNDLNAVIGYELHINAMTLGTDATNQVDRPLSNLVINMLEHGGASAQYVSLLENFASNVLISEFNRFFPKGICISATGKIPLSTLSIIDRNRPFTEKVWLYPDASQDLKSFVGFPYKNGQEPEVYIRCNAGGVGVATTDTEIILKYHIKFALSNSQTLGLTPNTPYKSAVGELSPEPSGLPSFSVSGNNLIQLSVPTWMYCGKSAGVYISNGLGALMNFGFNSIGNSISDYDLGLNLYSAVKYAVNGRILGIGEDDGREPINTDAMIGGYVNAVNMESSSDSKTLVMDEGSNSDFKRSFLWGLQIRSNNLSTTGEFVSGGQASVKVITDFVIDPSTNSKRDYLVYEPEAERFYPLNASGQLRQLDLSVYYVDMNNNTHPLNIPPNTAGSVKIEFRPKNMVYNYVDSNTQ